MNDPTKIQKEVIPIKGMHCKSCVALIESEIRLLEGVERITANLIENNAVVQFDPEKISLDKIKSEITSLGYSTADDDNSVKKNSLLKGLTYGLIPHTGCIAFIAASVLGATAAMNVFKPLLMNPYFFHILVLLSLVFATVSSVIYLRRNGFLSPFGVKRKWKYLSVMYGSTVGVNLLFFMVIFPLLANASVSADIGNEEFSSLQLAVAIPCPGHAPLISGELKTINGVVETRFSYPNVFNVLYDSAKTTKEEIMSLDVFNVYKATVIDGSVTQQSQPRQKGCCGCSGCRKKDESDER